MRFLDKNRYALKGTGSRWFHLASIEDNVHEYMCFVDKQTGKVYIEELTGGHLEFIKDDSLAQALSDFCTLHGILSMNKPFLPDFDWMNRKPDEK
jgi:hypothetical protein